MTSTSTQRRSTVDTTPDRLYASLIGVTALAVLLQGLWAGLFIREGKDYDATAAQANWVQVHDWGARAAFVLSLAALAAAVWRHRHRKDLVTGTAVLAVLLLLEAYIGGGIGDHPNWPSYHIPIAMALMALSVWLPLRAMRR